LSELFGSFCSKNNSNILPLVINGELSMYRSEIDTWKASDYAESFNSNQNT